MRIQNIESMEEWYCDNDTLYGCSFSIRTKSYEDIEKIKEVSDSGRAFYILTDKELEDLYARIEKKENDYKPAVDYLVEKLDKIWKKNNKK